MLAPLCLAALVPVAVAGTGEPSRVEIALTPAAVFSAGNAVAPPAASGAVSATVYWKRVVDDATPIALQPYLQRAGSATLGLRVEGQQYPGSGDSAAGGTEVTGTVLASVDGYVAGPLALFAGAQVFVDGGRSGAPRNLGVRAVGGFGLRFGDLRVDLGYRYDSDSLRGADALLLAPLPDRLYMKWGAVRGALRAVLVERIDVRLGAEVALAGYGFGSIGVDYYPSRRLGLSWGVLGGRGDFLTGESLYASDLFSAHAGASFFFTRHVGLAGSYAAAWFFGSLTPERVEQRLSLTVSTRW